MQQGSWKCREGAEVRKRHLLQREALRYSPDKGRISPRRDTVYLSIFERFGWGGRIRTYGTRYQKPTPYHLATPQL